MIFQKQLLLEIPFQIDYSLIELMLNSYLFNNMDTRELQMKTIVIGDLMLDKYVFGIVERVSPESGCPILRQTTCDYQLGGAANVAKQLKRLGANVILFGIIGNDENGRMFKKLLKQEGLEVDFLSTYNIDTTCKTRFVNDLHQQMFRTDRETFVPYREEDRHKIMNYLTRNQICNIVISDYNKGVITTQMCQDIIRYGQRNGINVIIDIKENDLEKYKGATIVKGNKKEIHKLLDKLSCKKLLMTKKKLPVRFTGQHFTIDKVLIKDAIRQANISNQDTVLDIGAGKGFLTVHLLKIANNVVAIENDTALVEHLRKLFSDARNVQVVGCDFRNFAVPKFPFKVVSNIPYGITSDIFKILMFESLGNFLGGSIVLQLEPTQKLFSRKLYNPYTVFYHTFFDLKLVYEVGPESFLPPPTVKSALLNIKRKHLFFDFKFKAKYLAFISCLLEKPDLSVKTALKSIFRKSQVRSISEKFGLNLNAQIVCLSPSQWLNCFLEMLEVVPEKFHPS